MKGSISHLAKRSVEGFVCSLFELNVPDGWSSPTSRFMHQNLIDLKAIMDLSVIHSSSIDRLETYPNEFISLIDLHVYKG